jgi:polyhydroxyalkanoate synthesis repressor PhaR
VTQKSSRSSRKSNGAKSPPLRATKPKYGPPGVKRRRGRPTRQEAKQRDEEYAQFGDERLIHRYGNRRFYDLRERKPVTLHEIMQLVQKGEEVRILDVDANNADITRRVLTDIILKEGNQQTLERLPIEFLRRLIATQDQAVDAWLDNYLKAGADLIERGLTDGLPAVMNFQKQLSELITKVPPTADSGYAEVSKKRDRAREIAELRRRLDELSRQK